jgi:hypothetical protein
MEDYQKHTAASGLGAWKYTVATRCNIQSETPPEQPQRTTLALGVAPRRRCRGNPRGVWRLEHAHSGHSARPSFSVCNRRSAGQSEEAGGAGPAKSREGGPATSPPDFRVAVFAGSSPRTGSFPLPAVCSWGNRGSFCFPLSSSAPERWLLFSFLSSRAAFVRLRRGRVASCGESPGCPGRRGFVRTVRSRSRAARERLDSRSDAPRPGRRRGRAARAELPLS